MKGLYLYCIRNSGGTTTRTIGVDGKSRVFTVPYKDIDAVVSTVDLKKYSSKVLAKKAKEDVKWIIKHVEKHERVIEHAMGFVSHKSEILNLKSLIPMKFGLIFEKQQNLEDILKKEYRKFKKLLVRLAGKQEWNVKVYAKEAVLKEKLMSTEKKVQTRIKRTQSLPRGADYFGELEVRKELDTVMQKNIDKLSKKFSKFLSSLVLESRINKVLPGELRGRSDRMVLNSAYLIRENKVHDFVQEIKKLQKLNPEFVFEYTGPWPPYNFVR
jgi:hypothetical protein